MKKLLNLILILALLFTLFPISSAWAQEPTAEPTQQPAAEPTAEPTQQPTTEPTAEPTQQPTTEPTAEPTQQPTTEPTAEPTQQPTTEPTAEVTATPTLTATIEVSPTVEITSTVEITATEGEITAQADPGSWTTTHIGIQNLENTTSNTVLTLYPVGSGSNTTINKSIFALGSAYVSSSEFSNGQYSGVLQSNTALAAGVINVNSTGAADSYAGVGNPGTKFTLPLLFRLYSGGWSSIVHVQNASTTDGLNVTFKAYIAGQTSPAVTVNRTLNANKSVSIDLSTSEFAAFGNNLGYGVVESSQNIAVVGSNFRNASNLYQNTEYNGLPNSAAGTQLTAPLVFNNYSGGWNSGIQIINVSGGTANVQMTYTPSSGAACVRSQSVAAGASAVFYLPSQNCASNTFGSVSISSSVGVVGIANAAKYTGGSVGYAATLLNPAIATNRVAVPIALNGSSSSSWLSGIQVVNLEGSSQTITAKFVRAGVDPTVSGNTIVRTATAAANGGTATFYMPSFLGTGSFQGAVFVEASGKIMALGSNTFYPSGYAASLNGVNY